MVVVTKLYHNTIYCYSSLNNFRGKIICMVAFSSQVVY